MHARKKGRSWDQYTCLERGHEGRIREVPREDRCSSMYIDHCALLFRNCNINAMIACANSNVGNFALLPMCIE
jgi:hypothetical protein